MAKRFGFFNSINGDRKYLATDISQAFNVAVTTGLQAIPDSFKIVPNDGMTVKMLPGGCMIYGAFCVDNEDEIIELDAADGELNRIDRIVVRYDRFERSIKTVVIKGTPALNPTAPAPLRDENQFDLVLADIRVNKAVTSITASDITDMRYSELCGFIGVKGAVTEERFESHLADFATHEHDGNDAPYIKWTNVSDKPGLVTMIENREIPAGATHNFGGLDTGRVHLVAASRYSAGSVLWVVLPGTRSVFKIHGDGQQGVAAFDGSNFTYKANAAGGEYVRIIRL